ncbi:MAG: HAD family hydrolase [Candidatus Margulisiibacteriota bacterium]
MSTQPTQAIVFDIGKVLFGYRPEYILSQLLPDTPHADIFLQRLFYHQLWQDLDRGDLSQDEAIDRLCEAHPDLRAGFSRILNDFVYHLEPIEDTHKLFLELHELGYPLYFLSNFQDKPFDKLIEAYPFMQKATGAIVSAKVNRMKPEPDIYRALIQTYDLNPEFTVFIDDLKENIAEAKNHGLHGIVYETSGQVRGDLAAWLAEQS